MGSTECIQGQTEEHREPLALVAISDRIPQDVLESFGSRRARGIFRISTQLWTGNN